MKAHGAAFPHWSERRNWKRPLSVIPPVLVGGLTGRAVRALDELVKASGVWRDGREIDWQISCPRRMLDAIRPLCDEVDKYILDHPGYKVTITIER